jgi:hypothetical protein
MSRLAEHQQPRKAFRRVLRERVSGELSAPGIFSAWRVPSTSTPGRVYSVRLTDERGELAASCTCPDQLRRCKHAFYVRRMVALNPWMAEAVRAEIAGEAVPARIAEAALRGYRFFKSLEVNQ